MPSEEECIKTLRELRWGNDRIRCLKCGSPDVKKDGTRGLYQMYHCNNCGYTFSDRTGTVFEGTHIPLRKWFLMAFLMQFSVSVLEVSKVVGMPYKSTYYIAKKIRESMYTNQILIKKLNGTVEMDELYLTAGLKGKKARGTIRGGTASRRGAEAPISVTSRRS